MGTESLPGRIRVSSGSAIVLGLLHGRLDAKPTTAYLLTYRANKCSANCGFCPQARSSKGRADGLSRVTWPTFPTQQVLYRIEHAVKSGLISRVCIQTLNGPTVFDDVLSLTREILSRVDVPISVSCQPFSSDMIEKLADAGVDRITIPLDAATEELFERVKGLHIGGPYVWEKQREILLEAVKIMGRGHVGTHLIAGLGEKEKEIIETIQWCVDNGIYPGLFAFTPVVGTALEKRPQPPLISYRRMQLAHYLITHGKTQYKQMTFTTDGHIVDFGFPEKLMMQVVGSGSPFRTSGCPGCNRPYYNEKPSGPIYNYPRQPLPEEITKLQRQFGILLRKRFRSSQY